MNDSQLSTWKTHKIDAKESWISSRACSHLVFIEDVRGTPASELSAARGSDAVLSTDQPSIGFFLSVFRTLRQHSGS
jgi:hypothetical protein